MQYNTTQKKLLLPEYGRNVQMMAEYLLTLEDKERRTSAAYELVNALINMNPAVKETKDYKQKMWNFLSELCGHKLEIDFPYPIQKASDLPPPEKIQYSTSRIKFRHYGMLTEQMIEAATKYEEGEEKNELIRMIANHMKKTYVAWNQKSVTDSIIIHDLYKLSNGALNLHEDTKLMHVAIAKEQPQQYNSPRKFTKQRPTNHTNNKKGRR